MYICNKIKQKLNEALLRGEKLLRLKKDEATEAELQELRECGYNVKIKKNRIIITE